MKSTTMQLLAILCIVLVISTIVAVAAEYQFTRNNQIYTVRTGTTGGDCLEDYNQVTQAFIGVACMDGDALATATIANGCGSVTFPGLCATQEPEEDPLPAYLHASGTLNCPEGVRYHVGTQTEGGGCDFSGSGNDRAGYCSDGEGNSQEVDCENGCGDREGTGCCCIADVDEGCGTGNNCDGT